MHCSINSEAQEACIHQDTLSICFMGDMMMHTEQINKAKRGNSYDFSSYFELIRDKISSADIAVANMEFTLAGEPYSGYPQFSAPDSYAEYLADVGFDIFLAANNHIFDKRSKGAQRTLDLLKYLEESHGIRYTGLAEDEEDSEKRNPLIINNKGISVALINFTYGTNLGYDEQWPKTNYQGQKKTITSWLEKAEESADITIALPHWGPEYQLTHSQEQEATALWLIDKGADAIIGSHPHVVQDTTTLKSVQVAYSLGNAVSNMSATNTQVELMATMRIVKDSTGKCRILPIEYTWLWCSRPGGFRDDYTIIPIEQYIDSKEQWKGQWEYDKMINTYNRIKYKKQ